MRIAYILSIAMIDISKPMSEQRREIPQQRRIQRIQLEPYDDVVSIKDRLQFVSAGRVLLVHLT